MADATTRKPPTVLELIWERDLVFSGRSGDVKLTMDSSSVVGPSPMQAVAFGLAGCMGMDVAHILNKGRHDLQALRVDLRGERAPEEPRRFTAITLSFTVTGDIPREAVERAVELSREKYCSVWHSLRQDITLTVTSSISAAGA